LIVALWVFLIAQFAVDTVSTLAGHEPFPTITMPAFSARSVEADARAQVTERTIQITSRDGTVHTVDEAALLAPLYSVPATATIDRLLKPSADVAPQPTQATIQYLKSQSERLGLASDPVALRVIWQPSVLDLRTLTVTPAGHAIVREVQW
jgi:hypothetical protein